VGSRTKRSTRGSSLEHPIVPRADRRVVERRARRGPTGLPAPMPRNPSGSEMGGLASSRADRTRLDARRSTGREHRTVLPGRWLPRRVLRGPKAGCRASTWTDGSSAGGSFGARTGRCPASTGTDGSGAGGSFGVRRRGCLRSNRTDQAPGGDRAARMARPPTGPPVRTAPAARRSFGTGWPGSPTSVRAYGSRVGWSLGASWRRRPTPASTNGFYARRPSGVGRRTCPRSS
jgi:hypothetical protein